MKKMSWKITQNLKKNTCDGDFNLVKAKAQV